MDGTYKQGLTCAKQTNLIIEALSTRTTWLGGARQRSFTSLACEVPRAFTRVSLSTVKLGVQTTLSVVQAWVGSARGKILTVAAAVQQ